MPRVTKSIRWSGEEWAVVEAAARVAGVPATSWVRKVASQVAERGLASLARCTAHAVHDATCAYCVSAESSLRAASGSVTAAPEVLGQKDTPA